MKLIDAIRHVIRPPVKNCWDFSAPEEAIMEALDIGGFISFFPEKLAERLKAYPIYNWMCTDEHVGLDALYLDDQPVGCVYRSSRKGSYHVKWISEQIAFKVREVVMSYAAKPNYEVLLGDEEIQDTFYVDYSGQALTSDGFYQGRPVKALVWYDGLSSRTTPVQYRVAGRAYTESVPYEDPKSNCVLVQDGDEQRVIPIAEFRMALNVKPLALNKAVDVISGRHTGKTGLIIGYNETQGWWKVEFDNVVASSTDTFDWFEDAEIKIREN